jgi:phage terminase large subunit
VETIQQKIDLQEAVGGNYDEFLFSKKRYLVCKGSRGSKKSATTALKFAYMIPYYFFRYGVKPNLLVIRRYMNTNWDSTRAQLIWAINKLGMAGWWKIPKSEHDLTFMPSGQQIIFRGMDDPQSITSITVSDGYLCWVWIEEAFQVTSESDFDKIDMSIRGQLPDVLFNQFVLTFNPWSDRHWLKKKFFDNPDENTLALTTNYMMNEFLSEQDKRIYEIMKERNPRRYRIEGLGEWGIAEGLIYENWKEEEFDIDELLQLHCNEKDKRGLPNFVSVNGMDFGYNDPTAFVGAYADKKRYKIYIYFEYYERQMENRKIANALIGAGFGRSLILADSEDPRTINELKLLGLYGIKGAKKGAGSVVGGIQKLQDYEIIVHPKCVHTIEALSNYAWKKDRMTDKIMNEPEHDFSHIPDALRYGCEDLQKFGIQV